MIRNAFIRRRASALALLAGWRPRRHRPGSFSSHPATRRRAGRRHAALPGSVPVDLSAGQRPPRSDDTGGEDRPDDPGRTRRRRRRHHPDHDERPRQRPLRWRLRAVAQHGRGLGRHGRPLPAGGARHPARDPAPLRRRLRARSRQPAGRHGLPAQHRPGCDPGPQARREDRRTSSPRRPAPPGRSGPSRRASAWPATTAGVGPTRASARRRGW